MTDMVIVPMEEIHLSAIARLETLCFSQPWTEEGLRRELTNPNAHFYAALAPDGEVAGYIGMHQILDEGYIANVAVVPSYRGRGIAQGLIAALQHLEGLSFLTLEVRQSNFPAIRLYEKLGFIQAGTRKGFYIHPVEDALIMTWNSKGEGLS